MKRSFNYTLALALVAAFTPLVEAAADDTPKKGVIMNKQVNPKEGTDDVYTLTLESYVTGENKKVTNPADIVLVLDVSGSMVDPFGDNTFTASTKSSFSFNDLKNTRYYYKYNNEYYGVYRYTDGTRYWFSIWIGETQYFITPDGGIVDDFDRWREIANATSETANILTDVTLYEGKNNTNTSIGASRLDGLQNAVNTFIEAIRKNSVEDSRGRERKPPIDNQIGIVKFAGDYKYTGNWWNRTISYTPANEYDGYSNYSQIRTAFTKVATGAATLQSDVNSLFAGGATNSNNGLQLAQYMFNQESFPANHKKTIVMFTDGASNQESETIQTAATLKQDGITIYTVGVFDVETTAIQNYMKSVSSGEGYYFTADTPEKLNAIFQAIAESSGADEEISSDATIKDEVTSSFNINGEILNEDGSVNSNAVRYYTQDYTKDGWGTKQYNPEGVTLTSQNKSRIEVTGFDYGENWVGLDYEYDEDEAGRYHGCKLVIEIDIKIDDDAVGGKQVNTNSSDSGLYYGDNFEAFPIPHLSIPITIKLKKHGLKKGESAVFSIYRVEDSETHDNAWYLNKANYPSTPYMQVNITGTASDDAVVKTIRALDPNYVYMIWEDAWTWSYATQDQNGKITTRGVEVNPFDIYNTPTDPDIKHSEAKVTNDFKESTKTVVTSN